MKTTKSILFTCLLLATTLTISNAAHRVLDTAGHPLLRTGTYFINSAPGVRGGGVEFTEDEKNFCPYEVVIQAGNVPIQFSPVNSGYDTIHVDEDIIVRFAWSRIGCPEDSKTWQVEGLQDLLVRTGGADGSEKSLFTIQKYGQHSYVLRFCPKARTTEYSFIRPNLACGYIGIHEVNGRKYLAVNRPPLKIVFRRV